MKANITFQNYGSSILLFIKGDTKKDAYDKWLSIFNWGGTSSEPRWVGEAICSCWSTLSKFQRYLFNLNENRLWGNASSYKGKMDLACASYRLAKAEFDATASESFRSVNSDREPFEFGVICAEKPDEDFRDSVLNYAFANR